MAKPDSSNILLGRADIRIANSSSYISNINPKLHSDNKGYALGQAQDCSLQNIQEFETMYKLNSSMPIGRFLTEFGVGLSATILNADVNLFALLFGYNPDDYGLVDDEEIKFTSSKFTGDNIDTNMNKWRVEAEFIYPDKENKMTIILPKASLINPSSPSLVNLDSPEGISFEFDEEEVTNSARSGSEMGKIVFGTVS